jgi:YggT family protein
MTTQELAFNSLGRGIAALTNPLFKPLKVPKSSEGILIPLSIAALFFLYGLFLSLARGVSLLAALAVAVQELANFLTLFFIVCVILGSITSPSFGGLPLYIFRLGKLWVKPVQNFTKIRTNNAVFPALVLIILLDALIWGAAVFFDPFTPDNMSIRTLILQNFGINILVTLLHYLIFLIIARALLSWFNPDPRNTLVQLIYYVTEPVLSPLRRIIPPLGMLDLSAFITIIVLGIAAQILTKLFLIL